MPFVIFHTLPHSSTSKQWSALCHYNLVTFSRILYKWNHITHTLCLASFIQHNYFYFIHVIACFNSLLSLYWLVVSHYMAIAQIYIHSPIEGHTGYFQFGAIINKPTINILLQVLQDHRLSLSSGKYLEVEFLGCIVSICLTF